MVRKSAMIDLYIRELCRCLQSYSLAVRCSGALACAYDRDTPRDL